MGLLLLAALLASVVALIRILAFVAGGKAERARRIVVAWAIGASVYLAILLGAATLRGETRSPYCDDDWCVAVDRVSRFPAADGQIACRMGVRFYSLANRGPRSATGAWIHLVDERGRRFGLAPRSNAIPGALNPKQSVATSLSFLVPADAGRLTFQGGVNGIAFASFIIGNGDLLGKPRIQFPLP